MFNKKFLTGILLVLAVLFAQVGNVAAAPQAQDTTLINGTIESITTETDADGVTTVVVSLTDEQGETQTVRLSVETAAGLYLIDAATLEVDETLVGQTVIIDPTTVLPEEEPVEEDVHIISSILADFFFDGDPEMASLIDSFHTGDNEAEQVFGFGVIAQALWMSRNAEGNADADLAQDILIVKKDKDYETFFEAHPEYLEEFGDTLPTNWGQFKKGLREKHENLGQVVSDQAEEVGEDGAVIEQEHGNGQDKNKDKDKNKKDKDKNKNKP